MKISEAIANLEEIMSAEGDIDLTLVGPSGVHGVSFRVARLRRPVGRESNLYYWNTWDAPESVGRSVVALGGGVLNPDPRVQVKNAEEKVVDVRKRRR